MALRIPFPLLFAYVLILLALFLVFNHGDIEHTYGSALAYLDGHFLDFYEENKRRMGGNDYFPLIYLIFAAWELPLRVLGFDFAAHPSWALAWVKLVLVLFFLGSVGVIQRIGAVVFNGSSASKNLPALLFATSPITVFAVFIFGGYDIIGVFFSLLGLYFYVKSDLRKFTLFFAVAASFKFFALVIYLPLLLNRERRLLPLLLYGLGVLSVLALQALIYRDSAAFQVACCSLFLSKVQGVVGPSGTGTGVGKIVAPAYLALCAYAFLAPDRGLHAWRERGILIAQMAYGLMLFSVVWHPQWMVILMPYFALAYPYLRGPRYRSWFLGLDLLGVLAYFWLTVTNFRGNVDVSLVNQSVLTHLIPDPILSVSDFLRPDWAWIADGVFKLYLFLPATLWLLSSREGDESKAEIRWTPIAIRFCLGLAMFLIPAGLSLTLPVGAARWLNPAAGMRAEPIGEWGSLAIGEIFGPHDLLQSFSLPRSQLAGFSVQLATYARTAKGHVRFRLIDRTGAVHFEKIVPAERIRDNHYRDFVFPQPLGEKGQEYALMIDSSDGQGGSAITAWVTAHHAYPSGMLLYDGHLMDADLVMRLLYDPNEKNP